MMVQDDTLCLHGTANIVIGGDKHPIWYELSTSSACGLVPLLLYLYGPESLLSVASRNRYVKLEIRGVQFGARVFRYCAPDSLSVEAARLFELIAAGARGA